MSGLRLKPRQQVGIGTFFDQLAENIGVQKVHSGYFFPCETLGLWWTLS